ncbi:hypothetical protein D3C86_1431220 [compost metagenome]
MASPWRKTVLAPAGPRTFTTPSDTMTSVKPRSFRTEKAVPTAVTVADPAVTTKGRATSFSTWNQASPCRSSTLRFCSEYLTAISASAFITVREPSSNARRRTSSRVVRYVRRLISATPTPVRATLAASAPPARKPRRARRGEKLPDRSSGAPDLCTPTAVAQTVLARTKAASWRGSSARHCSRLARSLSVRPRSSATTQSAARRSISISLFTTMRGASLAPDAQPRRRSDPQPPSARPGAGARPWPRASRSCSPGRPTDERSPFATGLLSGASTAPDAVSQAGTESF